jgi:hypothetical protein
MLRVAERCDVDVRRALEIVQQVSDAVGRWSRFARGMGVSRATARRIGKAIA